MQLGCPITGYQSPEYELVLHHCEGAQKKLDGVHVGEDFVYPLFKEVHDANFTQIAESFGYGNRHGNKSDFQKRYGRDIDIYAQVMSNYAERYGNDDPDINLENFELIINRLL
jgi:hypothetical protein